MSKTEKLINQRKYASDVTSNGWNTLPGVFTNKNFDVFFFRLKAERVILHYKETATRIQRRYFNMNYK